jgi:hypothetical protein
MRKIFSSVINGLKFLFTGGQYGSFVEGKMCPKCQVRRIKIDKKCCKECYKKSYR